MTAAEKAAGYTCRPPAEGARCLGQGTGRGSGVGQGAGCGGVGEPLLAFYQEGAGKAGQQPWDWLTQVPTGLQVRGRPQLSSPWPP